MRTQQRERAPRGRGASGAASELELPRAALEARELEHVVDQAREPLRLGGERRVVLAALLLARHQAVAQHLDVHADRRERRLQLVRDGGREVAAALREGEPHRDHAVEREESRRARRAPAAPARASTARSPGPSGQRRESELERQRVEGLGEAVARDEWQRVAARPPASNVAAGRKAKRAPGSDARAERAIVEPARRARRRRARAPGGSRGRRPRRCAASSRCVAGEAADEGVDGDAALPPALRRAAGGGGAASFSSAGSARAPAGPPRSAGPRPRSPPASARAPALAARRGSASEAVVGARRPRRLPASAPAPPSRRVLALAPPSRRARSSASAERPGAGVVRRRASSKSDGSSRSESPASRRPAARCGRRGLRVELAAGGLVAERAGRLGSARPPRSRACAARRGAHSAGASKAWRTIALHARRRLARRGVRRRPARRIVRRAAGAASARARRRRSGTSRRRRALRGPAARRESGERSCAGSLAAPSARVAERVVADRALLLAAQERPRARAPSRRRGAPPASRGARRARPRRRAARAAASSAVAARIAGARAARRRGGGAPSRAQPER